MSLNSRLHAIETRMGPDDGTALTYEASRAYLDEVLAPYRAVFPDEESRGPFKHGPQHSRNRAGDHEAMCLALDDLRDGEMQYVKAHLDEALRPDHVSSRWTPAELLARAAYEPGDWKPYSRARAV